MEIASQMSELTILRKEEEEKEVRPKSCKQGMGRRRWTRWQNDRHLYSSSDKSDIMEHMNIEVNWKSNFAELAREENKLMRESFRRCLDKPTLDSPRKTIHRASEERMFGQVDRRLRARLLHMFPTLAPFIHAVQYCLTHFAQWDETPCSIDVEKPLRLLLTGSISNRVVDGRSELHLPVKDIPSLRMLIHGVCQFYALESQTSSDGIMKICKLSDRKIAVDYNLSLCDWIYNRHLSLKMKQICASWRSSGHVSNADEDSDGFQVIKDEF